MNRKQKLSLALAAVLTVGVSDVAGQDEERRRGPRGGIDVEDIMSLRERLELNEAQIDQLEAWRSERLSRRSEERARMDDMRSRLRAGQIERSEMRTLMEERRDAILRLRDDSRARLEGILNERQLETLDGVVRERRAFARGRASAARGGRPGMRGGRGAGRSGRDGARGARPGMLGRRPGMRPDRPGLRGRPGMRWENRGQWGGPGERGRSRWWGSGSGNEAAPGALTDPRNGMDSSGRIEST